MTRGKDQRVNLLGEHGLSLLWRWDDPPEHHVVLMDFGRGFHRYATQYLHVDIDLGSVETLVLSMGTPDHVGAIS